VGQSDARAGSLVPFRSATATHRGNGRGPATYEPRARGQERIRGGKQLALSLSSSAGESDRPDDQERPKTMDGEAACLLQATTAGASQPGRPHDRSHFVCLSGAASARLPARSNPIHRRRFRIHSPAVTFERARLWISLGVRRSLPDSRGPRQRLEYARHSLCRAHFAQAHDKGRTAYFYLTKTFVVRLRERQRTAHLFAVRNM
jgi:hypothetical protein